MVSDGASRAPDAARYNHLLERSSKLILFKVSAKFFKIRKIQMDVEQIKKVRVGGADVRQNFGAF